MTTRGFSLIELVIGATMVLFISAMAMVVLVAVQPGLGRRVAV